MEKKQRSSRKTFVIAEIGINHNGDLDLAKKLIDGAVFAGADAVKFQKRTVDAVYTPEELASPRESPWGTTYREQKEGLELGQTEYDQIDAYCRQRGISWFASAWDPASQQFLQQYRLPYNKIASAMLTHRALLEMVAAEGKPTFISTGMSTFDEIQAAVDIFRAAGCPFELMHTNSTYPMPEDQANLRLIPELSRIFSCDVGYSGHEVGLIVSCAAVALGATSIERHITLDRTMYGTDQAASIEVIGFHRLVRYIEAVERSLGDGVKRITLEEEQTKQKLRRVETSLPAPHPA